MGDRANFGFVSRTGNIVYLYGHWAGNGMMNTLATALERVVNAGRETDTSYATRIAISNIIGEEWTSDLSWGITVDALDDNEHSIPVVNWAEGSVTLYEYDWKESSLGNVKFVMPIASFIQRFSTQKVALPPSPLTNCPSFLTS